MYGVTQLEHEALDILLKAMPGGIVAGYATDGFPICFTNEKYLDLLGYENYEEYVEDINGYALNSIHPEDRKKVTKIINSSYHADEQYGIEYRIKNKAGKYIHVYDIGKKVTTINNKDVIVCVLIDMTENVRTRTMLKQESMSDELTQIYNRRGGIRKIEKHLNNDEPYTFAIFDIDNLKLLNDEYNHKAGDTALIKFAELMIDTFQEDMILLRFGGDEFISFLPKKLSKECVTDVLNELQQTYRSFVKEKYPRSCSSVSIGCITGTKPMNFDTLYEAADALMYQIKKNGKNGCMIEEIS